MKRPSSARWAYELGQPNGDNQLTVGVLVTP